MEKSFLKNSMWSIVCSFVTKFSLMISAILAAHMFSTEGYGTYSTIHSAVSTFTIFSGLGLGQTLTRYISEYKTSNKVKAGKLVTLTFIMALISGIVVSGIITVFSRQIATYILHEPSIQPQMLLVAVHIFVATFTSMQIGIMSGLENFKFQAINGAIAAVLSIPINFAGIIIRQINGLLIANILVEILLFSLNMIQIVRGLHRYDISFTIKKIGEEMHVLWEFSIPAFVCSILYTPVSWLANAIITGTANGYVELGLFNAASQFKNLLLYVPIAIGNVLMPKLVTSTGNRKKQYDYLNLTGLFVLGMVMSSVLICFPKLLTIVFGSQYSSVSFYNTVILAGVFVPLSTYRTSIYRKLMSMDMVWYGVLENILWGGLLYGITYFLRDYGSIGLSFAYIIAFIGAILLMTPVYLKYKILNSSSNFNWKVVCIWAVFIIEIIIGYKHPSIAYRILLFVACNVIILMLFLFNYSDGKKLFRIRHKE